MRTNRFETEFETRKEDSKDPETEPINPEFGDSIQSSIEKAGNPETEDGISKENDADNQEPWPNSNGMKEKEEEEEEEPLEIVPPPARKHQRRQNKRINARKREFNPWTELDKASKKNVSRRDLITGLFRFLPRDDDKKK